MEDYNFWADLLASYRASPDGVKALWLMVPLAPALGLFVLAVAAAARLVVPRGGSAPHPGRAIVGGTPPEGPHDAPQLIARLPRPLRPLD